MAVGDAEVDSAYGSFLLWGIDSEENGGLIKDDEIRLFFASSLTLETIADSYTSNGVNVVEVIWEDSADSTKHTLYYGYNLGIDSDPEVEVSSIDVWYTTYSASYHETEKDALLSQYKRYATGTDESATFEDALSSSLADITKYTIKNSVQAGNLMNFKKSKRPRLAAVDLYRNPVSTGTPVMATPTDESRVLGGIVEEGGGMNY